MSFEGAGKALEVEGTTQSLSTHFKPGRCEATDLIPYRCSRYCTISCFQVLG